MPGWWKAHAPLGSRFPLVTVEQIVDGFVGGEECWCDFAVFAGPVEEDFLVLVGEAIWGVGSADVLLDAAGGIAEEEAFESQRLGGLVYRRVCEALLVQFKVGRCSAENRLDDLLAGLDRSGDLPCEQAYLLQ